MLAEDVVQQLQQNAERQRFRISMQREPEAAEGVTPARMEQSSPMRAAGFFLFAAALVAKLAQLADAVTGACPPALIGRTRWRRPEV